MFGTKTKLRRLDQSGMVSILVTMFLIIIMSLIVLAMSKNANREQRQSLDRQLSDQAFYNAMTGINDWDKYIIDNNIVGQKTNCDVPPLPAPQKQIDSNNSVSCVMYNTTPSNLEYDLQQGDGVTVTLTPASPINEIRFTVTGRGVGDALCGFNSLTQMPRDVSATCNVGALEANLVNTTSLARDNLRNNSFIGYFLPTGTATSGAISIASGTGTSNQGVTQYMSCSGSVCVMRVTLSALSTNPYLLHMKLLYKAGKVTVAGYNGATVVPFSNAQLMIDATGKARDILRRVQVRKPLNSQYVTTNSSVRTVEDLCKTLEVVKYTPAVGSPSISDVNNTYPCDLD